MWAELESQGVDGEPLFRGGYAIVERYSPAKISASLFAVGPGGFDLLARNLMFVLHGVGARKDAGVTVVVITDLARLRRSSFAYFADALQFEVHY